MTKIHSGIISALGSLQQAIITLRPVLDGDEHKEDRKDLDIAADALERIVRRDRP